VALEKCGKQFDIGGCMTYLDYFLERSHEGKCPVCGTQVVIRVQARYQPEVRERAKTLPEIRAVVVEELDLSVRTKLSLEQVGITTVGHLLDSTEARIRHGVNDSDSVIAEIERLLASKRLSLAGS
jgi:DNA-directed RNA polymerase alpha subunit